MVHDDVDLSPDASASARENTTGDGDGTDGIASSSAPSETGAEVASADGTGGDTTSSATTTNNSTSGGSTSADTTTDGSSGATTGGAAPADKSPIKVGVVISGGNPGAAVGAQGFGGNEDRIEAEVRAVVEHINANGGYGQHPVEMVFAAVDQTDQSESNQERLAAEMCERMTRDENVHLVISTGLGTVRAQECYAERQTALFELTNPTRATARPWAVPSTWLGPERMAALMAHGYDELGFLSPTMGVIAFDDPPERAAVTDVLIPGIEARGGKVLDVAYVNRSSYGDIAANISSAVLRFNGRIDRVIMFAKGGGTWLLFTRAAESQNYRPRYGLSSWDFPSAIGPLITESQHEGAVGVGFLPLVDNYLEALPEPDARQRACWQIINEGTGSDYQDFSSSNAVAALGVCEALFIGKAALDRAPGAPIVREKIPAQYRDIEDRFDAFAFERLRFSDRSPDAITVWSPFSYDRQGCACFRYTDGPRNIPE